MRSECVCGVSVSAGEGLGSEGLTACVVDASEWRGGC